MKLLRLLLVILMATTLLAQIRLDSNQMRNDLLAAMAGNADDFTIEELEEKLHPGHWIRIHRSTLLNIDAVRELHSWFGGKLLIKLKDGRTELSVARERAADVRAKLGV